MRVEVRVKGDAVVTYRCADCGQRITDEPRFETRNGRLVALHQRHGER